MTPPAHRVTAERREDTAQELPGVPEHELKPLKGRQGVLPAQDRQMAQEERGQLQMMSGGTAAGMDQDL